MMDLTIKSAGIAWAVPVKPDTLGLHLQAYQECLPKLTALRLCHRFGKGPDVHVTKIPPEILQIIEGFMFKPHFFIDWGEWSESFMHFESKCEPISHLYDDRPLDLKDEFRELECEDCSEYNWNLCKKGCDEKITELANQYLMSSDHDWRYNDCEGHRASWLARINQSPKGHFAQYDEVRYPCLHSTPHITTLLSNT